MSEALPLFAASGPEPLVFVTSATDRASDLARRAAADGADVVVAVGGDGHAAAVGEGLIGTGASLAVLPAGSANDYARALRMPRRDTRAAVTAIERGEQRWVDAIAVTTPDGSRTFLNVVGTGFDAVVAESAERIPVLRGTGRYVLAMMRELPRFTAAEISLTIDGEPHRMRAMMVALANGNAYGGGMHIAPHAKLDSGWLEICVVREVSKLEFVRAFPRVFRGTHVDHPAVTMLRGKSVEIDADRSLQLMGDGERLGRLPATVSVVPKALSVVVNHETAHQSS